MHTCKFHRENIEVAQSGIVPKDGKIYWHVDESNLTSDIDKFKVIFRLQLAFAEWQSYIAAKLVPTNDISEAAIVIRFMTEGSANLPEPFGEGTLAYAYFPSGTSNGIFSDIYFNDGVNWQESHSSNGVNLGKVATHEIGHALGVGHSDERDDIMFFAYQPNDEIVFFPETVGAVRGLYNTADVGAPAQVPCVDLSKIFLKELDLGRLLERQIVALANEIGLNASVADKKSDTVKKVYREISIQRTST